MTKLSGREWTVLETLWDTGGAELGQLVSALAPATGWSRNTVLTYLTRMEAKGLVRIDKTHSPHRYLPLPDREECRAQERKCFLQRVYRGSTSDLVTAFLKEQSLSPAERDRLRKLLDDMEV